MESYIGASWACEHANECGVNCTCPPECYCKTHTCKLKCPVCEGTGIKYFEDPQHGHRMRDLCDACGGKDGR